MRRVSKGVFDGMQIQFCGGAGTVTGSQHLLRVNGASILLECGLYQGRRAEAYEKNRSFLYDPTDIDAVLLSHAHIDHSGNIPTLIKNGYQGPVYASAPSVDLCQIMLRDSAYLQERDVAFANKIARQRHRAEVQPLYSIKDAEDAMRAFIGVQYNRPVQVVDGVTAVFRDAGHILGSAGIALEITAGNEKTRLGFTGDVGHRQVPILRDPDALRDLDLLIMESTYGDRHHGPREGLEDELAGLVRDVAHRGGKVIIPAFAVGRTQLIVYMLHRLFDQGRIPDIPIYVDSPLARSATDVFRTHPECFDRDTYRHFLADDRDPFGFRRLTYVSSVEESKALNGVTFPHVIISASGMAEGGRVLHHLRNNIHDHRNLVLLVGHAAQETLARRLMDGEPTVRIFGEEHEVRCQVKSLNAFSAHADQDELVDYVALNPPERLQQVFLVHGEEHQAEPLRQRLLDRGCRAVHVPEQGQTFSL